MSGELKPCPFCGGKAELNEEVGMLGSDQYFIECQSCLVTTRTVECASLSGNEQTLTKEEAIGIWNTRAGDTDGL